MSYPVAAGIGAHPLASQAPMKLISMSVSCINHFPAGIVDWGNIIQWFTAISHIVIRFPF